MRALTSPPAGDSPRGWATPGSVSATRHPDLGVGKMRVMAQARRIPSMTGFGLEVTGYDEPDTP